MTKLTVTLTYKEANAIAAYLHVLIVFLTAMPDPELERGKETEAEVMKLIKKLEQE